MVDPSLSQSPASPVPVLASSRRPSWVSSVLRLAVLLVNGHFLLGMGDCNNNNSSQLQSAPTLSALTLSAGLLNPSFDPNTTSYSTMYIGNTSITVTPTAASGTITVNGTPITSGNVSGAIALPAGTRQSRSSSPPTG